MSDQIAIQKNKSLNFAWVPDLLFRPRRFFQRISTINSSLWLTPLIILSIAVILNVLIVGRIKSQALLMGDVTYPPDFQYYSPEQQAQYMQATQSTQGPVFSYVLPSITSLLGVWVGWLILGGSLHLITTLFGGRGSTALSLNIVAWSSLPLVFREMVQIIYLLYTDSLISNPGLSGFWPLAESGLLLYFSQILTLIDIYLIWQTVLLILGVRISTGLNRVKSIFCGILTVLFILIIQSGFSYLVSLLGDLNISRPFFF
jgi:hypothetical protein